MPAAIPNEALYLQVLEEQKLLQKAYCWAKIKSWHLSKGAVPWGTCGKGLFCFVKKKVAVYYMNTDITLPTT